MTKDLELIVSFLLWVCLFFIQGHLFKKEKKKWSFLNKIACIGGIFRHSPHSPELGALTHNHILIIESMYIQAEAFGGLQLLQDGSDPVQGRAQCLVLNTQTCNTQNFTPRLSRARHPFPNQNAVTVAWHEIDSELSLGRSHLCETDGSL